MRRMERIASRRSSFALFALLALSLPLGSCATIAGTAVSPITGGVDLCREGVPKNQWYWMPFAFVGGAVAGPVVALYNGVAYDTSVFRNFGAYWHGFDGVFRPFHMISKP
jgi:hypothetical protein